MNKVTLEPQQVLLLLDISSDNPIPEDEVMARLPECSERVVLRLSKFGVSPTTRGQVWSRWREMTLGIDAMLAKAQASTNPRRTTHCYVAGRASLPLFAYLGLRRGRQAGVLTVINQRENGEWDVVPTHPHGDGMSVPQFFRDPEFIPGERPDGHLAVVVSTGYPVLHEAIAGYFARHRVGHAGTVVLETEKGAARWLGEETAPAAVEQISELFRDLRRFERRARGVALFVAGPAPLAVMAGRFLSPNIHKPIWIPAHDAGTYRDAINWPRGAVHGGQLRVLVLTASPADMKPIRVHEEESKLKAAIFEGLERRSRLNLKVVRGATPNDILAELNEFRPHVLHISAHGDRDGSLSFLDGNGDSTQVPLRGLIAAIKSAGEELQLVVLNACYSEAVAAVLQEHVDCAIGMRKAIADPSAIQFSAAFYGGLSHGRSIGRAFEQGLAAVKVNALPNSRDIELIVRPGCDASEWEPLAAVAEDGAL